MADVSRETPRAARRERRELCLQARRGARREGCIYSLATVWVKLDSHVAATQQLYTEIQCP